MPVFKRKPSSGRGSPKGYRGVGVDGIRKSLKRGPGGRGAHLLGKGKKVGKRRG